MSMPGGVPPESPDPAICDASYISEIADVATVAEPQPDDVPYLTLPATKPRSAFRRGLEVFLENKLAVAGGVIIVVMVLFCSSDRCFTTATRPWWTSPTRRCRRAPAIRLAPTGTGTTCSPG